MIIKPKIDSTALAQATYEKLAHPEKQIMMRQFRRADVAAVDRLLELAGGNRDEVKTEEDWRLVEIIFQFFMERWPQEYKDFIEAVPKIRASRNPKGYSKSKEMKYLGALPIRFERMVKIIFPYNQFNSKFSNRLVKRIPLFAIGDKV